MEPETLIIRDRVFVWVNGVLMNAEGAEVAAVEQRSTPPGQQWLVTWPSGRTEQFAAEADARDHIASVLRDLPASE